MTYAQQRAKERELAVIRKRKIRQRNKYCVARNYRHCACNICPRHALWVSPYKPHARRTS